jgi:hypothetical protein
MHSHGTDDFCDFDGIAAHGEDDFLTGWLDELIPACYC